LTTRPTATSSAPPPPVVLAPEALSAKANPFQVDLQWEQPVGGAPVDGYEIYRDAVLLDTVDAAAREYADPAVEPGNTYVYGVAARVSDVTSLKATLQVDTPVPALNEARLQGIFDVTFKLASQTGFQNYPGSFHRGWEFEPRCTDGACDVRWSDVDEASWGATLNRTRGTYSGSDTGDFNSVCRQASLTSKLTIEFHVTKAEAIDQQWRATEIVGTVEESEEAQLDCLSSSATLSITAKLFR
jgi:hypothetical protein